MYPGDYYFLSYSKIFLFYYYFSMVNMFFEKKYKNEHVFTTILYRNCCVLYFSTKKTLIVLSLFGQLLSTSKYNQVADV